MLDTNNDNMLPFIAGIMGMLFLDLGTGGLSTSCFNYVGDALFIAGIGIFMFCTLFSGGMLGLFTSNIYWEVKKVQRGEQPYTRVKQMCIFCLVFITIRIVVYISAIVLIAMFSDCVSPIVTSVMSIVLAIVFGVVHIKYYQYLRYHL